MSQTNNVYAKQGTHQCPNRRSVAEMQRMVDKRGKRNPTSRFSLAKGDEDRIAAWNKDLVRLLHVFNVRSISLVVNLRIYQPTPQTELAIDTNIMVADNQTMVANTQKAIVDTRTMDTDSNRTLSTGQEGASSKNLSVGAGY